MSDESQTQLLPRIEQVEPTQQSHPTYENCDSCGALVEPTQRYCVSCGARRRHVHDPAARYLAKSTVRSRSGARAPTRTKKGLRGKSPTLGLALVIAVIPLAVGLGALIGRSSNNDDSKLLAALRAQRAPATPGSEGTTQTTADTGQSVSALKSDFPLKSGWSVELQALPPHGTTDAIVSSDESSAKAKGAKDVGLIVASQYQITPAPTGSGYLIYSGAYKTKAQADQALSGLKKKFSSAQVIQVQPVGTGATTQSKVLVRTKYGVAHQLAGMTVTKSDLNAGRAIVNREAKEQGNNYIAAQKGLPDVISVP